jgi:hypothetical protein
MRLVLFAFTLFFLASCGIEEYYYLGAVPVGNINSNIDQGVTVNLPPYTESYFTGFAIFYHIYTSNYPPAGVTIYEGNLSQISSSLSSDHAAIKPVTTTDVPSGVSIDSLFSRRNYYTMSVDGANIDQLLNNSGGFTFSINFPDPQGTSTLTTGGVPYTILRSNGYGRFTVSPDRYFNFHTDLIADPAYPNINMDVTGGAASYRYVSMYIAAAGMHPNNLTPIYSNPTWLGVYALRPPP